PEGGGEGAAARPAAGGGRREHLRRRGAVGGEDPPGDAGRPRLAAEAGRAGRGAARGARGRHPRAGLHAQHLPHARRRLWLDAGALPGLRPHRRAVPALRDADREAPRRPARDPRLPALPAPEAGVIGGLRIGHYTDETRRTGCTVILPPAGSTGSCEVRGLAPGTRETALLAPEASVDRVDAILLTGGSAFGLAAADGVMAGLAADGVGHPTPAGPVPIVPAAVIFDRAVGEAAAPGPAEGALALTAALAAMAGGWPRRG